MKLKYDEKGRTTNLFIIDKLSYRNQFHLCERVEIGVILKCLFIVSEVS